MYSTCAMKLLLISFLAAVIQFIECQDTTTLVTTQILTESEPIILECPQGKSGNFQRVWKKNGQLLATDSKIHKKDPRISVQGNGALLTITNSRLNDSGGYRCELKQNPLRTYITTVHVRAPNITTEELDKRLLLVEENTRISQTTIQKDISGLQRLVDELQKEVKDVSEKTGRTISSHLSSIRGDIYKLRSSEIQINSKLAAAENQIQVLQKQTDDGKEATQNELNAVHRETEVLRKVDVDIRDEIIGNVTMLAKSIRQVRSEVWEIQDKADNRISSLDDRLKVLTKQNRESKIVLGDKISAADEQILELGYSLNASIRLNQMQLSSFEGQLKSVNSKIDEAVEKSESFVTNEQWITQRQLTNQLKFELSQTSAQITKVGATTDEELEEIFNKLVKLEGKLNKNGAYFASLDITTVRLNRITMENQDAITYLTEQLDHAAQTFNEQHTVLQQQVTALEEENQSRKMTPSTILADHNVAMLALQKGNMVTIYTWNVYDMQTHFDAAKSSNDPKYSVESQPFYTAIPGYRMVIKMYPNYKRSGHVGLFAGLRQGEFDNVVPWPFWNIYLLSMRMGETGELIDEKEIDPKKSPGCASKFRRPSSDYESSCGFQSFVSHESLDGYLADNNTHFQITIAVYLTNL